MKKTFFLLLLFFCECAGCKKEIDTTTYCWDCLIYDSPTSGVTGRDTICNYRTAPDPAVFNWLLGTDVHYSCTKLH